MCLVFLAFALTTTFSRTVFERLPHLEDELAYIFQARVFARGDVTIETPQPRAAYWQPFIVDYEGRRFSKYTPGWSAILALGVLLGVPWWINAVFSAGTVALVYRTGEEIFSPDVGLIAAFLMTFSPMFLLLGSSLMGHTAALLCATLFVYAYWRIEQGQRVWRWGAVAGVALGLLVVNRPLTSVGVASPFVVYSVGRLAWTLIAARRQFWQRLVPLITLGVITLLFLPAIPLYRLATTGDATLNPYTLVWEYDTVGFGPEHGRSGHTLAEGLENAGEDLSLAASDLFGWQVSPLTYQQRDHLLMGTKTYPGRGLSWVLLPLGIVAGLVWHWRRAHWTLLLVAVPAAVIGVHLAYWIGSQRYSTRYYMEGLAAAALLAAIFPGWLAGLGHRWRAGVYTLLLAVTLWSAARYTLPRLYLLRGFNHVTQARIDQVHTLRQTDQPAVVILTGSGMTWRANGTLMGVTGPYLDDDIVLARDRADGRFRDEILARFPDREIIDLHGQNSKSWPDWNIGSAPES